MRANPSMNEYLHKDMLEHPYGVEDYCCAKTELFTHISFSNFDEDHNNRLSIKTNRVLLAQRLLLLSRKVFGKEHPLELQQRSSQKTPGRHQMKILISATPEISSRDDVKNHLKDRIFTYPCCKKAFLRGLYWNCGYFSNPKRDFHLEIILPRDFSSETILSILQSLSVEFKCITRRCREILYTKSSQTILLFVNILGATRTLLLLQDILITKELKNEVNRSVNCEVGNLRRSSVSSAADIETVNFLRNNKILQELPENLQIVANARCLNPSLSLRELGKSFDPPLSKACVFNRLRRLRKEAAHERKRFK